MCDKFLYLGDKIRLRQDFYKMRQNSNKVRQHLFALYFEWGGGVLARCPSQESTDLVENYSLVLEPAM